MKWKSSTCASASEERPLLKWEHCLRLSWSCVIRTARGCSASLSCTAPKVWAWNKALHQPEQRKYGVLWHCAGTPGVLSAVICYLHLLVCILFTGDFIQRDFDILLKANSERGAQQSALCHALASPCSPPTRTGDQTGKPSNILPASCCPGIHWKTSGFLLLLPQTSHFTRPQPHLTIQVTNASDSSPRKQVLAFNHLVPALHQALEPGKCYFACYPWLVTPFLQR